MLTAMLNDNSAHRLVLLNYNFIYKDRTFKFKARYNIKFNNRKDRMVFCRKGI